MKKIWMLIFLLTTVVTGLAGCSDKDDDITYVYPDSRTEEFKKELLKGNYADLPLPIARQFIYMDAISLGTGTTISVGKYKGKDIYCLYHPVMSSFGNVFNHQGERLFNVDYHEGADWKQVLESPLTVGWEKCYPGAYQLFKLWRQFIDTVSATKRWDENKPLSDLPEWLANRIRAYKGNGAIQGFKAYQGCWNGETIYYLDYTGSEVLIDVITSDGKVHQWKDNLELLDFVQNSSQWQLLYVIDHGSDIGTESEYEHSNARWIQPVENTQEWEDFFATEVRHPYWDGDGNIHRTFFDQTEWDEQKLLVINSQSDFQLAYTGDKKLPEIDFDKYTLIIGKDWASNSSYQLQDVQLYDNGKQYILDIDIMHYVWSGAYEAIQNLFYWKVYPKLDKKEIILNRVFSFNYDK